ncbi:MAG TPA: polymorphic toxin type 50 domain-containing protein, partial [Rhabdochlamydiaceae bacterium]|nr:polymorphic toxin type 50 domain-containing protein [Rhabdochlamydiaceae bacterium]
FNTAAQGKHVRGSHNFIPTRSEWTHSNPESKIKQLAGKGQKVAGKPGSPGFRERVDCGEVIGYFYEESSGNKTPTTMAIIHYGKKGAHIVPAQPKR